MALNSPYSAVLRNFLAFKFKLMRRFESVFFRQIPLVREI